MKLYHFLSNLSIKGYKSRHTALFSVTFYDIMRINDKETEARIKTDKQVVRDILAGNKEGFSLIIERYERLLNSIIYQMVHNVDTTEDLTQEAFIKCYKKLNKYNEKYTFKYWLISIARNNTIDYLRKKRETADIDSINPSFMSYRDRDNAYENERSAKIDQAMQALCEEDRMILYLKYHQQYKNPEICNIMGIDEKHVRIKIYRAKGKLREIMNNMEYFSTQEV